MLHRNPATTLRHKNHANYIIYVFHGIHVKKIHCHSIFNKSPQSHLGIARRYPHVGECILPLRVLAVAYTMCYGTL